MRALTLLLTQAPELAGIIGDLLLSAMDFKESAEAAQRLKRMVPGQALGTGPSANEQKLMEQVQTLQAALAKALQKDGETRIKLAGKDELRDVQVYEAETKRLSALVDHMQGTGELRVMIQDLVHDAMKINLEHIALQNQSGEHAG